MVVGMPENPQNVVEFVLEKNCQHATSAESFLRARLSNIIYHLCLDCAIRLALRFRVIISDDFCVDGFFL